MTKTPTRPLYERLKKYSRARDSVALLSLAAFALSILMVASAGAFVFFTPWFYLLFVLPLSGLVWWLSKRQSLYEVARDIETGDPSWNDRLSTAVDLSGKRNPREVYSSELTEDYVAGIERRVSTSKLSLNREKRLLKVSLGMLGGAMLSGLFLIITFPARISFGLGTIFAPANLPLRIERVTADTLLAPGQRMTVEARIQSPVKLGYVFLVTRKGNREEAKRVRVERGGARAEIRIDVEQGVRFQRFRHSSDEIYLGLSQPFELRDVEFTVQPPAYTGERPRAFGSTRFSALPGSKVGVRGTASAELNLARLMVGDSAIPLASSNRDFSGDFSVSSSEEVNLILTSRSGSSITERIEVSLRQDELPLVDIFFPGKDQNMDRSMTLLLGVHVLDDYGLDVVRLVSDHPQVPSLTIARSPGKVEDTLFYRWDLAQTNLLPGDEIVYYVEARDNDAFSGPKWGRSKSYRLRFPGLNELFSEVTEYGSQTAGGLSRLGERQEELGTELSRIEEKLRTEQTLSPEEKQRLREIIEEQKSLQGGIDSLAKNTRELLANLQQGALSDPKTLEQLSALSEMLAMLMPPELREKLAQMAQAINQDPQSLAQALGNMAELSAQVLEQLEQALAVMERFIEEHRLSELAEKAMALAKMEENLIREASELSPQEAVARQQAIREGIEDIAREAEELSRTLTEQDVAQNLKELAEEMSGEDIDLSQKVEQSLNQGNLNQRSARKLSENLRKAGLQFTQLASNLQEKRQQSIDQEMVNLARELIILSEEQEKTLSSLGKSDNLELATQATQLERAVERKKDEIFRLAGRSFNVPRDAMHGLASASQDEAEFKQSLIEGQASRAKDYGRSALHGIDRAAASLLDAFARNCCGQQGSSTGLEQLMESLSSMSLAQLSLNQQMGGVLPLPISMNLSEAQRQALSQLASEQGALRRKLEELQQAAGEETGLSGMLEGIIKDMKAMEEDLSRYVGTRELVDRGEQVFRKLLDARNVLRKKEDEQRREREIGTVWENLASPTFPQDRGERSLLIKKELIRFLNSDYPESYKRLAREYLEALLEEE